MTSHETTYAQAYMSPWDFVDTRRILRSITRKNGKKIGFWKLLPPLTRTSPVKISSPSHCRKNVDVTETACVRVLISNNNNNENDLYQSSEVSMSDGALVTEPSWAEIIPRLESPVWCVRARDNDCGDGRWDDWTTMRRRPPVLSRRSGRRRTKGRRARKGARARRAGRGGGRTVNNEKCSTCPFGFSEAKITLRLPSNYPGDGLAPTLPFVPTATTTAGENLSTTIITRART